MVSNGTRNQPSPRRDARILLLALGTFAIATDYFVIAGVLKSLASDFAIRAESAGQVVTAYAMTYAVSSPLLATATARSRRERLVVTALAGFACMDLTCALSQNIFVFAIARVAAAGCAAIFIPGAYTLAAALWPGKRRGTALATVALGTTLAIVVGVPAGTSVAEVFGWRATFALDACIGFAAAVLLAVRSIAPGTLQNRSISLAHSRLIGGYAIVLSILATLFWSAGTFSVYTYISMIFGDQLGLKNVTPLLTGYGLGALAGSQSAGLLIDRFGPARPIIAAVMVSSVNFGLMAVTGGAVVSAAASLFIMAFCTWTALLAQQSRLLAIDPEHGAIILSFLNSGIYLGAAMGAGIGGILIAAASRSAPLFGASCLMIAGLLVFLIASRQDQQACRPA